MWGRLPTCGRLAIGLAALSNMNTVAIVGVGLIGGSFGLALRQAGFAGQIIGISSQPAIDAGLRLGAISGSGSLEEAAATADLIYLAQPVDRILTTLETLGPLAATNCLITDAGSTKTAIVTKASECLRFATFLGGHPLAGKEQRGVESAEAALFRGRPYVLTPTGQPTPVSAAFRSWLQRIGANVLETTPAEHDSVVALTSHLPQLLSTALAKTLGEQKNPRLQDIHGPGLLDMTRLALSSPDLWQSILETNQREVMTALDLFQQSLTELRQAIATGQLTGIFSAGASFARSIR
jgi:prephenate dehydrogenase